MKPERHAGETWSDLAATEAGAVLLECCFSRALPGESILFRSPERVIEAREPAEVPAGFAEVEAALAKGLYVAGFISYEAGLAFEPSLAGLRHDAPHGLPLLWFGCYGKPEVRVEYGPRDRSRAPRPDFELQYSLTPELYRKKVEAIRELIAAGETYQANLTMDVRWSATEHAAELYERLVATQPVPFAALLQPAPGSWVISLSPELFFSREGDRMVTRPMKGTAPAGLDLTELRANAAWLRADEKNRAENLMIVDLLRNDLGRICQPGTIKVPALFEIERYPTVLQMTSTVEGRLREGTSYTDIFKALFPSGSVVGAPKIHTMRLLHDLENRPRGVYTGAIGYMAPNKRAEFSVAIRTLCLREGEASAGVGSGIVYDSVAAEEYEECRTKTVFLTRRPEPDLQLIETILLEGGEYAQMKEHLERMEESAEYFDMVFDAARVRACLEDAARTSTGGGRFRIRLLLSRQGEVSWTATALEPDAQAAVAVLLSQERTDPEDRFLRHKTTHRALYDGELKKAREMDYDEVLFRNVRDEITECAIHNLILSIDGRWVTPPVQAGVLPGVYRRHLMEAGRMTEQVLDITDVLRADAIYICNSVRGVRRVGRVDEETTLGAPMEIWRDRK